MGMAVDDSSLEEVDDEEEAAASLFDPVQVCTARLQACSEPCMVSDHRLGSTVAMLWHSMQSCIPRMLPGHPSALSCTHANLITCLAGLCSSASSNPSKPPPPHTTTLRPLITVIAAGPVCTAGCSQAEPELPVGG